MTTDLFTILTTFAMPPPRPEWFRQPSEYTVSPPPESYQLGGEGDWSVQYHRVFYGTEVLCGQVCETLGNYKALPTWYYQVGTVRVSGFRSSTAALNESEDMCTALSLWTNPDGSLDPSLLYDPMFRTVTTFPEKSETWEGKK